MSEAESELQAQEPPATPVERLLRTFGGVQALARRLDVPAATVEDWRAKGAIPRERLAAIAAAAERDGIALDAELLAQSLRAAPTIEAEPAAAGAPPASPQPPRWLSRLSPQLPVAALGGALVVAGFLLAMGTSGLWLRPSQKLEERVEKLEENTPPSLEQLTAKLGQLEQQVAALQQQVQAMPDGIDSAALDRLRTELLAELERRLSALPTTDPARVTSLESSLAALGQQLTALERQHRELQAAVAAAAAAAPPTDRQAQALAALALAVAELGNAVRDGGAYAGQLAVVRALAVEEATLQGPLAVLEVHAESGIGTAATLREALAEAASAIAGIGVTLQDDDGEDILSGLSGLISVRPVGEVEGDTPAARVARAEQQLAAGDVAAALAELKALEGDPATAAAPWIAAAETYLATQAAVGQLSQLTLSRLSGN